MQVSRSFFYLLKIISEVFGVCFFSPVVDYSANFTTTLKENLIPSFVISSKMEDGESITYNLLHRYHDQLHE